MSELYYIKNYFQKQTSVINFKTVQYRVLIPKNNSQELTDSVTTNTKTQELLTATMVTMPDHVRKRLGYQKLDFIRTCAFQGLGCDIERYCKQPCPANFFIAFMNTPWSTPGRGYISIFK